MFLWAVIRQCIRWHRAIYCFSRKALRHKSEKFIAAIMNRSLMVFFSDKRKSMSSDSQYKCRKTVRPRYSKGMLWD